MNVKGALVKVEGFFFFFWKKKEEIKFKDIWIGVAHFSTITYMDRSWKHLFQMLAMTLRHWFLAGEIIMLKS